MKRKFNDEELKKIQEWMYEGKSIKQIARLLKVSRQWLHELMLGDSKLNDTIQLGKEYAEAWWEEQGQANLWNKEFNHQLFYMNMKNRFGWKDKNESVQTVSISHEIKNIKQIEEEYKNLYKKDI